METLCFSLEQALLKQSEILQEMLAAVRAHNQTLRENDVVTLREIIGREEEIIKRLKEADRKREEAHKVLANKFDLTGEASLGQLLSNIPESKKVKLSQLAAQLRNITGEIAELVELNSILTRRAMHFNEILFKQLKAEHNDIYRPGGESGLLVGRPALINKKV